MAYPYTGQRPISGATESDFNRAVLSWHYFVKLDITTNSYGGPYYYTDFPEGNISGFNIGGQGADKTWIGDRGFEIGGLEQSRFDVFAVSWIKFFNIDNLFNNIASQVQMRGKVVTIWLAEFSLTGETYSLITSYIKYAGQIDDVRLGAFATLNLKPHATPWGKPWLIPQMRMTCHNEYRREYCKYAGAEPAGELTCDRSFRACTARLNTLNFNGRHLGPKPGEELKYGNVT